VKIQVLGVAIDALTKKQALDEITRLARQGGSHQVVTANPEILDNASRDAGLRSIINSASLVTADGQGVLLAGRILGHRFPERVTGIELAEDLCAQSAERGLSLYFLGAKPGVAAEAVKKMQEKYPGCRIVGSHHGYFRDQGPEQVIRDVKAAGPAVLLVGLGSPFQEHFIHDYLAQTGAAVAIGVGGSFDVLSGRVQRAPQIFQRLKLEWLYRIATDRSRWKRSLALPRFVVKVLRQRITGK
jgi:N-acetylglucosaminyldiphosphoundecaprenol N-acetyl-beta-D-mannosaminyltransferase